MGKDHDGSELRKRSEHAIIIGCHCNYLRTGNWNSYDLFSAHTQSAVRNSVLCVSGTRGAFSYYAFLVERIRITMITVNLNRQWSPKISMYIVFRGCMCSLWPSSFKETKCFSPLIRKKIILWGASLTERWRARPQTVSARISNPVSAGQCHLIHLTILRMFSWPSLACICPMVS